MAASPTMSAAGHAASCACPLHFPLSEAPTVRLQCKNTLPSDKQHWRNAMVAGTDLQLCLL